MVKVAIIGAGIAGLSTYLFLRKYFLETTCLTTDKLEIVIYEAYDIRQSSFNAALRANPTSDSSTWTSNDPSSGQHEELPSAIGSAIGISKNGLNVLSRLDESLGSSDGTKRPSIMEQMRLYGHPIKCWAMSTARGFKIVDVNVTAIKARQDKSNSPQKSDPDEGGLYDGIMIARQSCWEILRDCVLEVAPGIVVKKKVTEVIIGNSSRKNKILFEDGSTEEADLVIGADGLRSIVRQAMFTPAPESDPKQSQSGPAAIATKPTSKLLALSSYLSFLQPEKPPPKIVDYITPKYEGLVGVGGFIPSFVLESSGHEPGTMAIVFGPNGFFGYGYLSSALSTSPSSQTGADTPNEATLGTKPGPLAGFWSTFPSSTPHPFSSPTQPVSEILATLKFRHTSWRHPSIATILKYLTHDSTSEEGTGRAIDQHIYPTYTTPELPVWSKDRRVVLVGDAAHALQPSSGQGACLALEDAETLVFTMRYFLSRPQTQDTDDGGEVSSADSPSATAAFSAAMAKALKAYEQLRIPRVHKIHEQSQKMSKMKHNMSVVEEYIMYAILYLSTRRWMVKVMRWVGLSDMEAYNAEVLGYDLPREVQMFLKGREEGNTT
jgi:2-polyprenyl-6-methoxyphenol hydroxylase-like FAD-dependent oxidoreductase